MTTDTESIRAKLEDPTANLADLARISTILRNTTEAEMHRSEIAEAANKSEALRFWIPVLGPTISAIAVVITLLVQIYQFQKNIEAQGRSAEDVAWNATTKQLQDAAKVPNSSALLIALMQMEPFFYSDRYGGPARDLGVAMLGHTLDEDAFKVVFGSLQQPATWSQLDRLGRLSKLVNNTWNQLIADQKSFEGRISAARTTSPANGTLPTLQKQLDSVNDDLSQIAEEERLVDVAIAKILKSTTKTEVSGLRGLFRRDTDGRAPNSHADLAEAYFDHTDLGGADFNGAFMKKITVWGGNLSEATIVGCDLEDAYLEPDTWNKSDWARSAWWRAKYITPVLLTYLKRRFYFRTDISYVERPKTDQRTYNEAVARLTTTQRY